MNFVLHLFRVPKFTNRVMMSKFKVDRQDCFMKFSQKNN